MKILVVHEVSYRRKIIYEIHEFPELLARKGHELTFLDFDEDATRDTKARERVQLSAGRIHKETQITLATPHSFGIGAIDRLWAIFSALPLLLRLFTRTKFDVVLNYAVPTYGLQTVLLARLFRVPVMHRALDVSNKIRDSRWNPLISLWERLVFLLAHKVSANNPAMENYVKSKLPRQLRDKVKVHYPPLDLSIFSPSKTDCELRTSLGIKPSDKILLYMGSFFYFSGLPGLIRGLETRLREDSSLKLLLIGGGEQEFELRDVVTELGIQRQVIFTGFVDFRELPKYMTLGHVALNPLQESLVASAAFPHKVLQYMAVGLPVVSTKLEGLYAAFGDSSGIVWTRSVDEMVGKALDMLSIRETELIELQDRQRQKLTELFSVDRTVSKLESSLKRLARKKEEK